MKEEGSSKEGNTTVDSRRTGEFLAALRKARGYTQQEVADQLHITNRAVSKWESGAGLPEIGLLPAVAELYGVTVDEILAGKILAGRSTSGEKEQARSEKRRKWLMDSAMRRYRSGQIVLWCTSFVGAAVMFAVYSARGMGTLSAGFGVIWLTLTVMGTAVFWLWVRQSLRGAWEENGLTGGQIRLRLYRHRMWLLLPVFLMAAAALPMLRTDSYFMPAALREPFDGLGSYNSGDLLAAILTVDLDSPVDWIASQTVGLAGNLGVNLHLNFTGYLTALPAALLSGSILWGAVGLTGQALTVWRLPRTENEKMQVQGQGRTDQTEKAAGFEHMRQETAGYCLIGAILLLAAGTAWYAGSSLAGKKYEQSRSVYEERFESEKAFDTFAKRYFTVYDAYRAYAVRDNRNTEWPELAYGAEVIDNSWLDEKLAQAKWNQVDSSRYEGITGVIGFDYEENSVWRVRSLKERAGYKTEWSRWEGRISLVFLAVLWALYAVFYKKGLHGRQYDA